MGRLTITIVKPDWQVRGGFEVVLGPIRRHLRQQGHRVAMVEFDAWGTDHRPFGLRLQESTLARSPEFFSYLAQVETVQRLRIGGDVVISTQPPSFIVDHHRHLALFYHHRRWFYELAEYAVASGQVEDSRTHQAAIPAVRTIDAEGLDRVTHILAGSETVAERLRLFNGRTRGMSVFHAGPGVETVGAPPESPQVRPYALCISRHDFPKRTELFVHAMHLLGDTAAVMVGAGGRLGSLRQLDRRFSLEGVPDNISAADLWLNRTTPVDPALVTAAEHSPIRFSTNVTEVDLRRLLRNASCLVAPALLEDYGLTVIEAMQSGVPVVVCRDGGHLTDFVENGVNGLVVEPDGRAIADAVRSIMEDPLRARSMSDAALERGREFTWARAFRELDAALEQTLS